MGVSASLYSELNIAQFKTGAPIGTLAEFHCPPVGLGDLSDDCEPESVALVACRVSAVEHLLALSGRNARPRILDVETPIVLKAADAHGHVLLAVAAFGAGRILGLDAIIEKYDLGGESLVKRYPRLRYILG